MQSLKEYYKVNGFAFLFGFGGSVWGGMTYFLGIPVALLTFLNASSTQIGLITSIFWAGFALPQIWAGYKSEPLTIKKRYIAWSIVGSSIGFLVYGIYLLMTNASNASFSIWFFLLAFGWASFIGGLYIPGNFSLLFKIIPSERLGQLLGIYFAIQFGGIVASGFAIKAINNAFPQPMNYAVMFLITFVVTLLSAVIILLLNEPKGEEVKSAPSLGAYIGKLVDIYKTDKLLVKFLIGKWLMTGNYIMGAFLLAFLIKERGFNAADAGWFSSLNALGLFIGGFTITKIADVYGPKYMLLTSQIIAAVYTLLAIFTPGPGLGYIFIMFVVTGLAQISDNVGYTNMCLFCCPTVDKSSYVAATNIGIIPFMIFGPIVVGQLIDKGMLSFIGAFWLSFVLMVIASIYILFALTNPKAYCDMMAAQKKA